jgi:hypothetical protein
MLLIQNVIIVVKVILYPWAKSGVKNQTGAELAHLLFFLVQSSNMTFFTGTQ